VADSEMMDVDSEVEDDPLREDYLCNLLELNHSLRCFQNLVFKYSETYYLIFNFPF
jgi:hypothetical protein